MEMSLKQRFLTKHEIEPQHIQTTTPELFWNRISQDFYSMAHHLICYTAVFSVVTQRSSTGEERCVTTLKTAVEQTTPHPVEIRYFIIRTKQQQQISGTETRDSCVVGALGKQEKKSRVLKQCAKALVWFFAKKMPLRVSQPYLRAL